MESSWCKSSPVKAVACGPAASVAIHRVTGGCEAYTVSKQAVRIQLRNRPHCDVDAFRLAEDSIQHTVMRGGAGIAGVASPGHVYKGISREPRRAHCFSVTFGYVGAAQTKAPGLWSVRVFQEKRMNPQYGVSCCQGKPEAQARVVSSLMSP